jgi:molecular chaperone Hsp33
LETYFAQSEQLPTRLWLACDASRAAGLLLQELPGSQRDPETWSRVQILAATVTDRELLELSLETLCGRLFPEDDIRVFTPERVTARCTCGRETVTAVLRSLGRRELEAALRETGTLELTCEFCNRRYVFDPVDVELILAGSSGVEGPGRRQ